MAKRADKGDTTGTRAYDEYREIYRDKDRAESYYKSSQPETYGSLFHRRNLLGWLVTKLEVRAARRLLARCRGNSAVDVPCGSGKLTQTLTDIYKYVIGMDASLEMMSKIGGVSDVKPDLVEADIRSIPLADSSVDVVVCNRFLHRMPPEVYAASLKELYRVSRRYALLYFNVRGVLTGLVMAAERLLDLGNRGRVYYMSAGEIKEELRSYGWEIIKSRPVLPLGISTGYLVAVEKRTDSG